jgi:hypothetical protein
MCEFNLPFNSQFFQTLFFAGCLFHDVMKILNGPNWLKLGSTFQTLLSLAFSSIILPTGIVSNMY